MSISDSNKNKVTGRELRNEGREKRSLKWKMKARQ